LNSAKLGWKAGIRKVEGQMIKVESQRLKVESSRTAGRSRARFALDA
jgi:hypothetical protein